jgi:alkaline phosphatase D
MILQIFSITATLVPALWLDLLCQLIGDLTMLDRSKLHEASRYEGGISRRLFLAYAGSLSALPWLGRGATAATREAHFSADPFTLGVASGDPTPRGVVLWTRLAPRPLEPGGGLAPENIEVGWEVAKDEAMRDVVSRGRSVATSQLAHSVHVEVDNLAPDRWYWYRFRAGDAESPIGRTRTMPRRASSPDELRFAFASCQHYESGLFTAYQHMAQENLDLVVHLGDYIYEYGGEDGRVRKHIGRETQSLDDYRIRYAQYRSDPLLQTIHARCPWMVVWDDHEFDNNCADDCSEEAGIDPVDFLIRRANAYQAYYEMMPLRRRSIPRGPDLRLYRTLSFGRLAEFQMLDTRQYRTDQPNGDGMCEISGDCLSPNGTLLGSRQFGWLQASLIASAARWNVLAQQVMMALVRNPEGYYMDGWPGYVYERGRLMNFLHERRIANPIVITGDAHTNWVNELRTDDREPGTPIVATEFMGTSISSAGDGQDKPDDWEAITSQNPCVRFLNGQRGYVRCVVSPQTWQSDFRVVEYVSRPGAPVTTHSSFVVESSEPGVKKR